MEIRKILNNNVVVSNNEADQEIVVMGRGCRRQVEFYTLCSFSLYTSAENMLFLFFIR
ncbi:hypothetical protein M662_07695 [Bacillus sp. SB49]|uniref:CAT RNA binding domain-containing protein n=1 Tax=Bacillus sp. SB49 TaxID=1071080 RepID=UPI00138AE043|nr:CAT RNA binding domain-containing protein [Bacillus sp. SB49]QHT46380.1 hypothetical protein M662_07695 [Bacillus sp. SB49]